MKQKGDSTYVAMLQACAVAWSHAYFLTAPQLRIKALCLLNFVNKLWLPVSIIVANHVVIVIRIYDMHNYGTTQAAIFKLSECSLFI